MALDRQRRTPIFRYTESATGNTVPRTLPIAEFLWRIVQYVLPSGFRRVRNFGFVHHNAAKTLKLVQLVLQVIVATVPPKGRPPWLCSHCQLPMQCVAVMPRRLMAT
ncbi:MAG: transposase [Nitrococcus sp.]|nr:transposase [Nitrococcus sp.]